MTEALAPVFATTFLYAACKIVGPDAWPVYLRDQLANLAESQWPALRTLGELSHVCPAQLVTDASTYIDRARCVAAGRFLASKEDVWLTVDDDIFADEEVLRRLILTCRATGGGVALPYMNRDGRSMTFRRVSGPTVWLDVGNEVLVPIRTVDRVGFGCVALHRELVTRLARQVVHFRESDHSPLPCPHLFVNDVDAGTWTGEDYAFSKRCEASGSPIHVLLDAPCEHAGLSAMLDVEGRICVADPDRAATLDGALRASEKAFAVQPPDTHGV